MEHRNCKKIIYSHQYPEIEGLEFYDYLESTGTQYIDTGLKFTNSQGRINIKFSPTKITGTSPSTTGQYNGIVGLNNNPQIGWYTNGWTVGNAGSASPYLPEVGKTYEAQWGNDTKGKLYIDNQDTGIARTGTLTAKLFYVGVSQSMSFVKVYSCKIYFKEVLTLNLVPCSYNGEAGMWDLVENKFYGNSGTGTFKLGNKIKDHYTINKTICNNYRINKTLLYLPDLWMIDASETYNIPMSLLASSVLLDDTLINSFNNMTYELRGSDLAVNGKWVDRGNGAKWTINGCTNDGKSWYIDAPNNHWMSLTSTGTDYNLGNHFRCTVVLDIIDYGIILDFGSIQGANKNIGFWYGQLYTQNGIYYKNNTFGLNWKLQGNNNTVNKLVRVNSIEINTGLHILYWEIVDAGNGYDKLVVCDNGIKAETDGVIPKATNFSGYNNWSAKNFYIGRAAIGNTYTESGKTSDYALEAKIYGIFFNVYD